MLNLPAIPANLGHGEDHQLLQQSAARFVAQQFDKTTLRRLYDDGELPAGLHRSAAELGYTASRSTKTGAALALVSCMPCCCANSWDAACSLLP